MSRLPWEGLIGVRGSLSGYASLRQDNAVIFFRVRAIRKYNLVVNFVC